MNRRARRDARSAAASKRGRNHPPVPIGTADFDLPGAAAPFIMERARVSRTKE
jgi:hypothetical protein